MDNNTGKLTNFIVRKQYHQVITDSSELLSDKYNLYSNFIHNDPAWGNSIINYHNADAVLHDNYIWLTTKTDIAGFLNCTLTKFYAQNVITNVKYLIHEIKETPYGFTNCSFFKQ